MLTAQMISTIFLILLVGMLGFGIFRNAKIYKYRMKLIEQIALRCDEDIDNEQGWKWRWDVFESVSYDEMMYKFWKKLDDFYPDKTFITQGK